MKRLLSYWIIVILASASLLLQSCTEDPLPDSFFKPTVTASFTEVSFGIVKLTCTISNSNFKECGFWYGTTSDLSDKLTIQATTNGRSAEAMLSNLEPGRTYYFQAYVDGGKSIATSSIQNFTIDDVMNVDAPDSFTVGYAETDIQITVETSLPIKVDLGGVTWIKETKTKALDTYHKVFHIYGNTDLEARSATIRISTQNGEFSKEIPIRQSGGPILIPDVVFKQYLVGNFDKDGDGELVKAEAESINSIDVRTDNIKSVQGIEYMPNLTQLSVSGKGLENGTLYVGALTSLDVSKNTALTSLTCSYNKLTKLDLSKNTALKNLFCSYNKLSSLDISKNTDLTILTCIGNQLTSLDVSKNTALTYLACSYNQLTNLDVSKNTALTSLLCSLNQLTRLNVIQNSSLTQLHCNNNPYLTEIWLKTGQTITDFLYDTGVATIYYLDDDNSIPITDANFKAYLLENFDTNSDGKISVKEAQAITVIDVCTDNIQSVQGIEFMDNLTQLIIRGYELGAITSLDVSKNTALTVLQCYNNQLTSLDVSKNIALIDLNCHTNQLTSLNVSKNIALDGLSCSGNQLTSLDVSKNTALTYLACHSNQLTSLDVSKNTALSYLYCDNNQVKILDVSKNTALTYLSCQSNQLTSLDVSKNTALISLECRGNQLTSLDIRKNTALTWLNCDNNQLTSLDVSKNTALTNLCCDNNQVKILDVSKNTALTYLSCQSNQLTSLDVRKNTALTWLNCEDNRLTSLNVCKNTALTELWCQNNPYLKAIWLKKSQDIPIIKYDNSIAKLYYIDLEEITDYWNTAKKTYHYYDYVTSTGFDGPRVLYKRQGPRSMWASPNDRTYIYMDKINDYVGSVPPVTLAPYDSDSLVLKSIRDFFIQIADANEANVPYLKYYYSLDGGATFSLLSTRADKVESAGFKLRRTDFDLVDGRLGKIATYDNNCIILVNGVKTAAIEYYYDAASNYIDLFLHFIGEGSLNPDLYDNEDEKYSFY